jgi:hypothetical protein
MSMSMSMRQTVVKRELEAEDALMKSTMHDAHETRWDGMEMEVDMDMD